MPDALLLGEARAVVPAAALKELGVADDPRRREAAALAAAPHGVRFDSFSCRHYTMTSAVLAPVGGGEWVCCVVDDHACHDDRCCHRSDTWAHGRYAERVLRLACSRQFLELGRDLARVKAACAALLPAAARRGTRFTVPPPLKALRRQIQAAVSRYGHGSEQAAAARRRAEARAQQRQ
jgi:hypothetical protein